MKGMTIAGLPREGGVGVATVCHYQRLGLLPVQPRPLVGGTGWRIRRYGQEDLRRRRFVREARRAGFSLEAAGRLLAIGSPGSQAQVRVVAFARVA
jgi:MerR family mercuric resistance operon transcriptional regulator